MSEGLMGLAPLPLISSHHSEVCIIVRLLSNLRAAHNMRGLKSLIPEPRLWNSRLETQDGVSSMIHAPAVETTIIRLENAWAVGFDPSPKPIDPWFTRHASGSNLIPTFIKHQKCVLVV